MADEQAIPAPRRFGRPFAKGKDPRRGVKKRKETNIASALETARREGFNAIELGIRIVLTGHIPEQDGTQTSVDVKSRLKLLRELAGFIHPKAPIQVNTKQETTTLTVNMEHIMMDPKLAA